MQEIVTDLIPKRKKTNLKCELILVSKSIAKSLICKRDLLSDGGCAGDKETVWERMWPFQLRK